MALCQQLGDDFQPPAAALPVPPARQMASCGTGGLRTPPGGPPGLRTPPVVAAHAETECSDDPYMDTGASVLQPPSDRLHVEVFGLHPMLQETGPGESSPWYDEFQQPGGEAEEQEEEEQEIVATDAFFEEQRNLLWLAAERQAAEEAGIPWQQRGPPGPAGPSDETWRGQRWRKNTHRWANRGGKNKELWDAYYKTKKKDEGKGKGKSKDKTKGKGKDMSWSGSSGAQSSSWRGQ